VRRRSVSSRAVPSRAAGRRGAGFASDTVPLS
jgi:hypothetical protein